MSVERWIGEGNPIAIDIFKKKYLQGQEFDIFLERVSGGNKAIEELIVQKKFLFGGRILANRNLNTKGSINNCYSIGYAPDDYEGLMDVAKNLGLTYKAQGGQGVSMSKLRPKGAPIGSHYKSDGIVPFMRIFNEVTSSTSQGGCLDENSLVLTKRGIRKIKDIIHGDYVWTKNGFIEVNHVFDKGMQETYTITTKSGTTISATADHKFATSASEKTSVENLSTGDNVVILNGQHPTEDNILNPLAYFLGAFMGDGYITPLLDGGTFKGAKPKIGVADKIIECLGEIGRNAKYQTLISEDNPYFVVRFDASTAQWIDSNGWNKQGAENVFVPSFVMEGDYSTRASYLCGAFDTDGSIMKYSSCARYTTISEDYARQIMALARSVGMVASISSQLRKSPRKTIYIVCVSYFTDINPLVNSVRVGNLLERGKNTQKRTPYTMSNLGWKAIQGTHLAKVSYGSELGLYTYSKQQNTDNDPVPMYYDEIVNIEKDKTTKHVYDLSLVSEHMFWCNGVYVSNSRKGALMISVDARHKEAMDFITLKSENGIIEKANLSLEIDDLFMEAVQKYYETGERVVLHEKRSYSGHDIEYDIVPIDIYLKLVHNSWDWGDPACLFTDEFRTYNIMEFDDDYQIETCNPCGEVCLM